MSRYITPEERAERERAIREAAYREGLARLIGHDCLLGRLSRRRLAELTAGSPEITVGKPSTKR
jgi:hypothetical protein